MSSLYDERLTRIKKAVALEKPDRTPVFLSGPFFLKYGDPEAKMIDMVRRPEWGDETIVRGYNKLKAIDAGGPAVLGKVETTGTIWLSKTRVPGREIGEDDLWQIDEVGLMTAEDYDTILKVGWKKFLPGFLTERLGYSPERLKPDFDFDARRMAKYAQAGLVNLVQGIAGGMPYDSLCAGRGMGNFTRDLYKMPDKVKAVLDAMTEEMVVDERAYLRAVKPYCVVCVPCVRANAGFLSRKNFERFGWPLFKTFADVALEEGANVMFHMDSRWDEFLDFFTDFPAGRCIFDPDGTTDIYRIKKTLGDRMCITGDISSATLAVGTPDEVYNYSRKLIAEIGPSGFILSSGCSVPSNAKPENVEALVAAAVA